MLIEAVLAVDFRYTTKSIYPSILSSLEKIQNGIIWTQLSKDMFIFKENVFICNMYIPP